MASSSTYKRRRDQAYDKVKKYEKWLKQLRSIRDAFTSYKVTDCQGDINKQLTKAVKDLNDAVDGCGSYNAHINEVERQKEPEVLSDRYLSGARNSVIREIERIEARRVEAKSEYEENNRKYKEAKKEEAEEAVENVFESLFSFIP